jgi:glycosyltransferase involved in cell wall biosynthesis
MPTIVEQKFIKKLTNVKPLTKPANGTPSSFTNVMFPFGKKFGSNGFGSLVEKMSKYKPASEVKLPVPGEGLPRVIHYCADQSGCAFWRMIWPGDEMLSHNKAVIMTLYQMVTVGQFYQGISAVRLQRQCTAPQLEFIKFLRGVSDQLRMHTGKGFRIIWEVDDVVGPAEDIPDYNVCKSAFIDNSILNTVREMTKYVDEITVVSDYMRNHYQKHLNFNKISVIPNYAPRSWFEAGFDKEAKIRKFRKRKNKPRVLYAGSGTHFDVSNKVGQKDDFGHVVDAIAKDILVDKKYEWVFFGALPMKLRQFIGNGIEFHNWTAITDYMQKLKELDVDVSLAPLADNTFSRAKANIKLTEAGILGIPCIAQNINCYNSDGWKYLFDKPDEMMQHIKKITESEKTYRDAVDYSREYAEKFMLHDHLDEYLLLYTTEYGDSKRKECALFLNNNKDQF